MKAGKVILVATLGLLHWPVAALEVDRNLEFEAGDFKKLMIDAGAGSLQVKGDDGDTIRVQAHINIEADSDADAQEWMDETMKLGFSSSGSKVTLDGRFDNGNRGNFFTRALKSLNDRVESATIDLIVTMPAGMDLDVDDGSGDTEIADIKGDLWVDDGSGNLSISAIGGNVEIDDGSGHLTLQDIGGELRIDDGSGDLTLEKAAGDLTIDDGSGNMTISDVRGNVDIDDGSGNLEVRKIGGNVRIDDGSGNIVASDLEQDLIIDSAGSGGVKTERIAGRIVNRD